MRHIENRLHPNEPWFTLRGQDLLAPLAIQSYATHLRAAAAGLEFGDRTLTGDDRKVVEGLKAQAQEAEDAVSQMLVWQAQNPDTVKLPD